MRPTTPDYFPAPRPTDNSLLRRRAQRAIDFHSIMAARGEGAKKRKRRPIHFKVSLPKWFQRTAALSHRPDGSVSSSRRRKHIKRDDWTSRPFLLSFLFFFLGGLHPSNIDDGHSIRPCVTRALTLTFIERIRVFFLKKRPIKCGDFPQSVLVGKIQ